MCNVLYCVALWAAEGGGGMREVARLMGDRVAQWPPCTSCRAGLLSRGCGPEGVAAGRQRPGCQPVRAQALPPLLLPLLLLLPPAAPCRCLC
jgi:hypothetical protein